eukprot:TRINITY_DN11069_c0_g1_i1.p1 TRINITY_DN11069_c0_g1~~TRINITY_DN11069_c0_g1_i1.p1  ORF type:complete len:451 (+),score=35.35 TRINITY_DN11069_c0_g1_i1:83-1354(+)
MGNILHIMPTIIGHNKYKDVMKIGQHDYSRCGKASGMHSEPRTSTCGTTLEEMIGMKSVRYPFAKSGRINGYCTSGDFAQIMYHTYHDHGYLYCQCPDEYPLFVTVNPHGAVYPLEKQAEFFFEDFNVPSLFFSSTGPLPLYAIGKSTGIVVDVGDGGTYVTPVVDGYIIKSAVIRAPYGGADVTNHLMNALRGYVPSIADWNRTNFRSTINNLINYNSLLQTAPYPNMLPLNQNRAAFEPEEKEFGLPDGQCLKVGLERYFAAELYFQPSLFGFEEATSPGVIQLIENCLRKCPIDERKRLSRHIVIAGGGSRSAGFAKRFTNELNLSRQVCRSNGGAPIIMRRALTGNLKQSHLNTLPQELLRRVNNFSPQVTVTVAPRHATFHGGTILAKNLLKHRWLTKEEYDEEGPFIFRKCTHYLDM